MKEPKFKIGQRVKGVNGSEFIIGFVSWDENWKQWAYSCRLGWYFINESNLEDAPK